jgi:drug/metabolite transporter (DMT)-like permease
MSQQQTKIGMFELSLAQMLIGVNIVVVKSLIAYIPILLLLNIRFIIATFISLLFCFIAKEPIHVDASGNRITKKDLLIISSQALCAGVLFNVLMQSGLHFTSAIDAGIISSVIPAAIALLSFLLLKEKLSKYHLIGIVFAVMGVLVINLSQLKLNNHHFDIWGTLLITAAVFPEAMYTIITKWHNCHVKPVVLTLYANAINAIAFTPLALYNWLHFQADMINVYRLLLILIYSLSGSIFFIAWYRGLKKINAGTAALFTAIMPISTIILSLIFLGERINAFQITGTIIILFSIYIGTYHLRKKDIATIHAAE